MQNGVNAVIDCQQFENQIVCFNARNTNGEREKAILSWASCFFEKCRARAELTGQAHGCGPGGRNKRIGVHE